jgi:hypothetical protein
MARRELSCEKKMTVRLLQIRCQATSSEYREPYCVRYGELESV